MYQADCAVIGAGVVGLAVARAIALRGREVFLFDAASSFGTGISSRNSEVIHSGIYYSPGSLKARLCARGRHLLYEYCALRSIPYRRCGKLIVATDESQLDKLNLLAATGQENGVDDLAMLDHAQAIALEPQLRCRTALLSPSTGIVDSHSLMLSLLADAQRAGATAVFHTPVLGGRLAKQGVVLSLGGDDPAQMTFQTVVNCAALGAQALAFAIEGFPAGAVPPLHLAKGNYFSLAGKSPFSRLVYPLPEPGGLGVHLTLDMGGQARFGPDVEWVEREHYEVDPSRADVFYAAIRRYWPALPEASLQPAYAGIRPKLCPPPGREMDFLIQGPEDHGVPGLVNLFGIESPGLTASLAIGEEVTRRVSDS